MCRANRIAIGTMVSNIETFKLSKLGGDPDDVELFQFYISAVPLNDCLCYLANDKVDDVAHGVGAFLKRTELNMVEITLGSFQEMHAGGAVQLRLLRQEERILLSIDCVEQDDKRAEDVRHVDGYTSMTCLTHFLRDLQLLGPAHSGVARLEFRLPDSANRD